MTLDPRRLDQLVCPVTRTPLRYDEAAQELISDEAGLAYPIRDGVAVMLVEEARTMTGDGLPPAGRGRARGARRARP